MQKLNFYERTILESINVDDCDFLKSDNENENKRNKILFVYDCFLKEYGYNIKRYKSELVTFEEWLKGLPSILTVPFYNSEILENARKAKVLNTENLNEEEENEKEEDFLKYYFFKCANAFLNLKDCLVISDKEK